MYFNGEIVTRKKNNKGTAWNKINDAGAANLEKWIAEGKYKSYDEDRSVSKIPNSGTQLKNTPAKINGSSNTSNISKNTTIIIPAHNIPSFKPAKTFVSVVK